MELKVRKWKSPECHTRHQKDKNVAINIVKVADIGIWNHHSIVNVAVTYTQH